MGRRRQDHRRDGADGDRRAGLAARVDRAAGYRGPCPIRQQPGRRAPAAGPRIRRGIAAGDGDAATAPRDHPTVAPRATGPAPLAAVPVA